MENIKFPIYGDKIVARFKNEDELDNVDYIEIIGELETIWLAEEEDYNMIEAETGKAKVKGKKMTIFIIKLTDGSYVVEGKKGGRE